MADAFFTFNGVAGNYLSTPHTNDMEFVDGVDMEAMSVLLSGHQPQRITPFVTV